MKSLKAILVIFLGIVLSGPAQAQKLNAEQETNFRKKIEEHLEAYRKANQLTSDWVTVDQNMLNQLKESFILTNKQIIFNDMLPPKVEGISKYINPTEYIQFAQKYYPEGLDVGLDILDIKILKDHKKGQCNAIVKTKKTLKGLYGNFRIHRYSGELYFYVKATLYDNTVDGVRIERVADADKHRSIQGSNKLAGVYVGGSYNYGYHTLYSSEIMSGSVWMPSFMQTNQTTYEIHFMFTKGFGLGGGFRMGKYTPTSVLEGYHETLSQRRDFDNDYYSPVIDVDRLEEVMQINTYDIPVFLKFRSGSKAVGLYLDLGAVYSMYTGMTYSLNGTASRKGYYPDYNVTLENIDEYGYFTNKTFNIDDRTALTAPEYGLSAYASLGFSIQMFRRIMLRLGVSANYSLTNLASSAPDHLFSNYELTGNRIANQVLHSASADFGVYLKLF